MYKSILCSILLVITLISCANWQNPSKVKFEEGHGISYDSTKLFIFFENGFKNTSVSVFVDSTKMYNESISTKESIELAAELTIDLPQNGQTLSINLNKIEYNITFPIQQDYNILLVNKVALKNKLVFQKKHYYYD